MLGTRVLDDFTFVTVRAGWGSKHREKIFDGIWTRFPFQIERKRPSGDSQPLVGYTGDRN